MTSFSAIGDNVKDVLYDIQCGLGINFFLALITANGFKMMTIVYISAKTSS